LPLQDVSGGAQTHFGAAQDTLWVVLCTTWGLGLYWGQRLASHGHKVFLGIIHLFIEKKDGSEQGADKEKKKQAVVTSLDITKKVGE
jgi:hypothetical protein